MVSQVKVLKNRNLPLRHLPCLPRQFGFWKKLVESEILFGETELRDYRGGWVYLSGEESQQPNRTFALSALNIAIINVLWFQWGIQSHQTNRFSRIFKNFWRFFALNPFLKFFFWFLFAILVGGSMFALFRKSKVTFEEQN